MMAKPFALTETDDGATLELYGEIGDWGVTAEQVAGVLATVKDNLTVRCSSPGGDAFEGIALMNLLRAYPGKVTGIVEGYAASAASLVMVGGCDHLIMRPHAELMIHEAWTFSDGRAGELMQIAADLERMNDKMAAIYAEKAGGDPVVFREAMGRETWYTADEAVLAGLADEVKDGREQLAGATPAFAKVKAAYRYRGPAFAPDPEITNKEEHMTLQAFARRLGCADDADEATILAALDEALHEQADAVEPEPETAEETEMSPVEVDDEPAETEVEDNSDETTVDDDAPTGEAETEDEGPLTVTIDVDTLKELQEQAAYGVNAKRRDEENARAAVVDAAIKDNRISTAARGKWLKAMAADPEGTKAKLEQIPKDLIPRAELGHSAPDSDDTVHPRIHTKAPGFGAIDC